MEETQTTQTRADSVLEELKHLYGAENSTRGRVLISQAIKILENYKLMPGKELYENLEQARGYSMSEQGKKNYTLGVMVRSKQVPKQTGRCLWCGSEDIEEIADFPSEGFKEFQCKGCKQKFFQ